METAAPSPAQPASAQPAKKTWVTPQLIQMDVQSETKLQRGPGPDGGSNADDSFVDDGFQAS
ncbi:MAG: hypothetical protein RLZZ15_2895 [Verrucomicrobiota bacterium]|jgi:hypothetical protein